MKEIYQIIARQTNPALDVEAIKPEHTLAEIGIDSLKFLLLILDLEAHTQSGLFTPERVAEIKTVGDVLSKLEAHAPSKE
ncbi:MAG: phosphopantetheine-binding protein [Bacteroidota bacterium]